MEPMSFSDYRQYLLQAVEIVMQGTEAAQNQVRDMMAELARPTDFSINSLIWQPTMSSLRDSLLRREAAELWLSERLILTGASSDLQRVYICYDFRRYMSDEDLACLAALYDLCQFLERFPFTAPDEALEEHAQQEQAALAALAALPHATDMGMNSSIAGFCAKLELLLPPIALKPSLQRMHYLIPMPPFTSLQAAGFAHQFPNVGSLLGWAKRALGALTKDDWLMLMWHLTQDDMLVLSLL